MQGAIVAENGAARREGDRLLLPSSPDFALDKEIKNVVTAAAKTRRYQIEPAATHNMQATRRLACRCLRSCPRRHTASGAFFVFARSRSWPQIPRR